MSKKIIESLPVVALRGRVIFPGVGASFDAGRISSLKAIKCATDGDSRIFICAQKDPEKTEIVASDMYSVGTVVRIKQVSRLPGNSIRLAVEGVFRGKGREFRQDDGAFFADVERIAPVHEDEFLEEAYFRTVKELALDIASDDGKISKEAASVMQNCSDADVFCNLAAHYMPFKTADKQKILQTVFVAQRLEILENLLRNEQEISRLERKINAVVRQNIDKNQKEYYLREQLKAIHAELGDDEEEKDELEAEIKERGLPEEVEKKALKELSRMGKMPASSPEYNVIKLYLDWLLDIPWTEKTEDSKDLKEAVKILNEDHYGLDKIKERITEYLAVLQLTGGLNAPILCFVGPPGVGKTSIASSIARALGRKFVRMSLGGVKDEAEIRGHRKTYIGSMPGRIITAMKTAGVVNPVFLLDEVDKLSSDMRGDPASALLEVLDPAQNSTFRDRYLEVPYDLSKVLFLVTANTVDTIPAPLYDRMEVIRLGGYTREEKREIAKRFLLPKRREANGLKKGQITISDGALNAVISGYTMEAGVRGLERQIDALCRKAAVKIAGGECEKLSVTEKNLHDFLGAEKYEGVGEALKRDEVGAATGLAWTAVGGTTLTIEVSAMHGKGDVLLTGKLGDVMKESARAAISYIRSKSGKYGIDEEAFETTDIHIHVPEGATPKDGPSAGITMATAILSAFTQKPVRKSVAMTGEITLRGNVLPIGGLKEKALAAYSVGIKDVIIPADNRKDLEEVPEEVRANLNFIPVSDVDAVFRNAIIGL